MKNALGNQGTQSLTFGGLVTCCTFVPVINLLVMPVAVCGATLMWVENYRNDLGFNMNRSFFPLKRGLMFVQKIQGLLNSLQL